MGEAPAGRRVTPVCTGPPHARGRAHARTHGPPRPLLLSAGAWIVTGGSHTGVMKQVGKAVRDSSLSSGHDDGDVVTIGIATWGVVHNREGLVHPEVSRVAAPGLPRGGLAPRGVPRVLRWQVTPRRRGRGGTRVRRGGSCAGFACLPRRSLATRDTQLPGWARVLRHSHRTRKSHAGAGSVMLKPLR